MLRGYVLLLWYTWVSMIFVTLPQMTFQYLKGARKHCLLAIRRARNTVAFAADSTQPPLPALAHSRRNPDPPCPLHQRRRSPQAALKS
jgi:hypothetical protein